MSRDISVSAALALKALGLRKSCGRHAAMRFAQKHSITGLYRLACQLRAAHEVTA